MLKVQLPDGRVVAQPRGLSVAEILERIDPRLAAQAVAAEVDGQVVELSARLSAEQVSLRPLTLEDPQGLALARHSCAHVMAEAICSLWPQTRLVYGPPVENGFYYDVELDHPLSPEDFGKIEAKMAEIVRQDRPFRRYELPRAAALEKLRREGNRYKLDNAERADGQTLSFYVTGQPGAGSFEDLCRGPHVARTSQVGAFKLMNVAGAYYRGDASEKMLQRVYGTSWPDRQALEQYLGRRAAAQQRDHRRLGQELGLFTIQPLVGPGLVLWKPQGAVVRHTLESFIRQRLLAAGYQPVYTPHIGRLELYRISGHYPYYKQSQYPPLFASRRARLLNELWEAARAAGGDRAGQAERELLRRLALADEGFDQADYPLQAPAEKRLERIRGWLAQADGYLLRPMNCPHHVMIYASEPRSYRELPLRLAEFGTVYRYEQSGEVSGLTRARGFTQDDAHLFCTAAQLPAELAGCVGLSQMVLEAIGLSDYRVRVGLRGPGGQYIGSGQNWARAEAAVVESVRAAGIRYTVEQGEATFYGPKIDFVVRDCLGREWQLGTVQVDYNLPERFALKYVGADNREQRPVMVHRALFGSLERCVGILIEHFAGAFPLWLAPVQVVVCTVSQRSADYARQVCRQCRQAGLRVELDEGAERVGAKIRRASLRKVPYVLVVGQQEASDRTVNVRTRAGRQLGNCPVSEFLAACAAEIAERGAQAPGEARQASS